MPTTQDVYTPRLIVLSVAQNMVVVFSLTSHVEVHLPPVGRATNVAVSSDCNFS